MMTKRLLKQFPPNLQLSLLGLELVYVDYDNTKEYVIKLAHKRLRRATKAKGGTSLAWFEATQIADTDLLNTLRSRNLIKVWRECPPWVVYVY